MRGFPSFAATSASGWRAATRSGGLVLAGLALSAMIEPSRWVEVGSSPGSYAEHLDRDSVARNGTRVTLWTRRDYVPVGSLWQEIEVDCANRTDSLLAYVWDDGHTISHNVIRPHRESAPIGPGSVAERIFEVVCH